MLVNVLTIFCVGLMTRARVATQQQSFDAGPGNLGFYNHNYNIGVRNSYYTASIPTNVQQQESFIPSLPQLTSFNLSPANQHKKKLYQKGRLLRENSDEKKRGRQGSNCIGVCTYVPDRDLCPTHFASRTEPADYDGGDYDYSDEDSGRRRKRRATFEESNQNGTFSSLSQSNTFHVVFPSITMFAVDKGAAQTRNVMTKKGGGNRNKVKTRRGRRLRRPSSSSGVRLRPSALEQEVIIRWDRVVERGPFIGGDIVIPDGVLLRPPNLRETSRWPNADIPYTMDRRFNDCRLDTIYNAMDEIEDLTCVRFVERERERDYLRIRQADFGCASYVGMVGGRQDLNLSTGCFSKFTVTHELIHAIGFDHEQSRRDRNKFIEVDYDNVRRGKRSQFVVNPTNFGSGFPYDTRSIMHYSAFLFARDNCEPTIYPVDTKMDVCNLGIGNGRGGMTKCDAAKINKLYKCGRRYSKRCKV